MRSCIAATAGWISLAVLGLCALSHQASAQDLTIVSAHTGTFQLGQTNAYYLLRVKNVGSAASSGYVSVAENAPSGLTVNSMLGDGWTCTVNSCGRSDGLAAGASYPAIMVVASVALIPGSSLTNQATVSGGGDTTAANNTASDATNVVAKGYALTWGDNTNGVSSVPAGLSSVVAIAAGSYHGLALNSDGTVVAWGDNGSGQATVPAGLSNVVAIAGGGVHSLALKSDGTVVAWGDNRWGQTIVPDGLSNVVALAGGDYHSLALKSDGTVVAWGDNTCGQASVPADLSSVIAMAGGEFHSLALQSEGTVVAWGDNTYGQANVPADLSSVASIAAGGPHSLALKSAGSVVAWGDPGYSMEDVPAGVANVAAVAAGYSHNLALKSDGTIVAWGRNLEGQTNVPPGLSNVIAIAAKSRYSLALLNAAPATIPVTFAQSGSFASFGKLVVDGTSYSSTISPSVLLHWTPGGSHSIGTNSPVALGSILQYAFTGWSDGGAITHTVAPVTATTYTAIFKTQYQFTTATNIPAGGSISPASGFFDAESFVQVTATPNPGYAFAGFSGGLSGTISPQNLKISGSAAVTASFVPASTLIIASLGPFQAIAGGAVFTLTINGANFVSGSIVNWGNTALTTTFVNASQLTAVVPANLIATVGTANVTVTTSAGTSSAATFQIKNGEIGWITQSLPYGLISTPYLTQIVAQGNNVRFSTPSTLPTGFTLSPTGLLAGTTAAPFNSSIKVDAVDGADFTSPTWFNLEIDAAGFTDDMLLPIATSGVAYNYTFHGVPAGSYTFTTSYLPSGFALSPDGVLSGTPTNTSDNNDSFQVALMNGPTTLATRAFFLQMTTPAPSPITAITGSGPGNGLPDAVLGSFYSATLSGGYQAIKSVIVTTGGLPPGLALQPSLQADPAYGTPAQYILTGTPLVGGTYIFRLRVVTVTGAEAESDFTIHVSTLGLDIAPLDTLVIDQPVNFQLVGTGGTGSYSFSVPGYSGNALPAGLTLSPAGLLNGWPRATSHGGSTIIRLSSGEAQRDLSISWLVAPPAVGGVTPQALDGSSYTYGNTNSPDGVVGHRYTYYADVWSYQGAVTWTLVSGSLPPGMQLYTSQEDLSKYMGWNAPGIAGIGGVPTVAGDYEVQLMAQDTGGGVGYFDTVLHISALNPAPVSFAYNAVLRIPPAVIGSPYALQFAAQNASGALTFALQPGSALPPGITLSPAGLLSGTATGPGCFSLNIEITDASGQTLNTSQTLDVYPLGRTPPPLSVGVYADKLLLNLPLSIDLNQTLYPGQGTAPYIWTLNAGLALPDGVTIGTDSDGSPALLGTPTKIDSFNPTLVVTDARGQSMQVWSSFQIDNVAITAPAARQLPPAVYGTPYASGRFIASGFGPGLSYSFSPWSDTPVGMSLSTDGILRGTPKQWGDFLIIIQATDSNSATASKTYTLQILAQSVPVPPAITGLIPSSAATGGAAFTLTANGTNFVPEAVVEWNGSTLVTSFLSASQLTAGVSATLIASAGTANVMVLNPTGAASIAATFTINAAPPTATSFSPGLAAVGGAAFSLTVNGTGFNTGSVVHWNATTLTTTYVNSTQLSAAVTASLIASAASAAITVVNPGGASSSPVLTFTVSGALRFIPVTPCRILDTRKPDGLFSGPVITAGTSRDYVIPNSTCNIPATAQAYSLNVTVVPPGPLGYLKLWPTGQALPVASTLNSLDGRIKANAAIVPAGTGGAVSVYVSSTTHVVLDIDGYFVPITGPSALAFYPLTPCRVADTRVALGTFGGPSIAAGTSRTLPILSSSCGVPADAQAYSLNFTAVPSGALGYLITWPTGQARPLVSTLNSLTGAITANAAIVPAGLGGAIDVYASSDTNLVVDINGYFAPARAGGLSLYNLPPCRVMDSRKPAGSPALSDGVTVDVDLTNSGCGAPPAAQAYVLNATVVPPGSLGYLILWPQSQTRPKVSTLNALDAVITSNMAIVPTSNGSISLFPSSPTHVVLDISAYFAP